jgi:fimbrial isopeptide formation D2 family protein/LPXTG-motif cell wall-anchored protein
VNWITTAIGDTVHFTVTTTIPGFGPAFVDPFFKMTDNLTDLTLVANSVQVTAPAAAATAAHIDEGTTSYTVDFNTTDGRAYLQTLAVPTEITVEYDAIVNTDAPLNVNFERNEVWTEFSHDINDSSDHSFKKDDTIHYTFTIDAEALANGEESQGKKGSEIVKVGRDSDGNPINNTTQTSSITSTSTWQGPQQGAQFKLYRNEACTEEYIPKVKGTGAAGTALTIESGADGRMTIPGLDAGEYWLKEVSCPDGFVMDTHVAHIEIETVESDKNNITEWTTDGTTWISQDEYDALPGDKSAYKSYTYSVKTLDSYTITIDDVVASSYTFINEGVEPEIDWEETVPVEVPHQFTNNEGVELPSTGGIGTTLFYTIGAILVIGAGIVLITRRRMSAQ